MYWTTDRIRQSFLDFFAERGHTIVPSASLIPKGDPTLLFTNAGMVPFKDYFLGIRTPAQKRVVDCQKCLRISGKHNDLEAVGRDSYHHTFFEMLGNWSFGDYYKKEAIAWHWELITKVWKIPADKLYATIYRTDDEARDAWLGSAAAREWEALGIAPAARVLPFDEKDNFWEMGETGPCGPCSEIHIDRGEEASQYCTHERGKCAVNVDGCARFIELGNLVFIQYNRDASGKLTPLPMKHVDTGTGLERVASVLQSIETGKYLGNYDTDNFLSIVTKIKTLEKASGHDALPARNIPLDVSRRAIADHARAVCFLIADDLKPSNNDRGYVLRRLIRRAVTHGNFLTIYDPFLDKVCETVIDQMQAAYTQLAMQRDQILNEVRKEEERFRTTLSNGLYRIGQELEKLRESKDGLVPGKLAFELYDTYGFPLDLTEVVFGGEGLEVDVEGFNRLMEEQRARARAARKGFSEERPFIDVLPSGEVVEGTYSAEIIDIEDPAPGIHTQYESESEVIGSRVDKADRIRIVTAETPFYPEGGGQIGDRGVMEANSGALLEVLDTRNQDGFIVHLGRLLRGDAAEFERGRRVHLKVDRERRNAAMRNHSATHILHYALREIAGEEVHQAGSLVEPGRLRFDFNHQGPIAPGDLATIEEEINARIRENAAVTFEEMAYDDALKAGALAFFGDKYGDRVRVVRMGDFSVELCGGTHVNRTGDIGLFKLQGESGVAAGVRRIEALTGQGALDAIREREKILEQIGTQLGARDAAALDRLERLVAREKELEKKLRALEQKLIVGEGASGNAENIQEAHGIKIVTRKLDGVDPKALREMADRLRQKHSPSVVALGSDLGDGKAAILVAVTADLTARIKAGDLVKQIAPIIGGSGGGRPDFAQAGGRDASKLDAALGQVATLLRKQSVIDS